MDCDDTILMERIIKRMREGEAAGNKRSDDNIDTALKRIRTFNQFHQPALEWLKENVSISYFFTVCLIVHHKYAHRTFLSNK